MKYLKNFQVFNETIMVDMHGNLEMPDYLSSLDSDDEDDAYDKGIAARENGCDEEENPYDNNLDPMLWEAWNDGYNS